MKHQLENPRMGRNFGQINTKNIFNAISSRELTENIILFLVSRIAFMDYLISPFGTALFCALFMRKKRITYPIFSVLGVASLGMPLFFFKYTGSILIICAVLIIFKKELEHKKRICALLSAASVLVNGSIYVIFEGFFAFDTLLLLLECALTLCAFFLFDKGIMLTRSHKRALDTGELLCIAFLPAAALLSVALTENFEPLAHVAAVFFILFTSLTYGASGCAPVGAVFGLALGADTAFPAQLVCVYTLASVACGLTNRYGRLGVSASFAVVSFLSTVILCPEANGILTVTYVAAACILLMFVPEKAISSQSVGTKKPRKEAALSLKISQAIASKFSEITDAAQSVSTIFYDVVESLRDPFYESTSAVFEATSDVVCSDCSLCRFCWSKERKKTLSAVERMCSAMEEKNVFSNKDIPEEFSQICIRSEAFAAELSKNLESFKVAKMWSGKLMESKRLVAEQFKNISMILTDAESSIREKIAFLPDAEQRIAAELEKLGICMDKIAVYGGDGYLVEIQKPSCDSKTECDTIISATLSEILEVPMVRMPSDCKNTHCSVSFCEKPRLKTDIATASAVKKNSSGSGDTVCCFSPAAGKVAILLCDGMGSGEHANYQSNIAAQICKKLMTAGFNKETCVRLVNDILMTGADRDSFSTMDMCVINLYVGSVEFIKAGAPDSYMHTGKNFGSVSGSSLPVGMIQEIEPDTGSYAVCAGDYIVMATDGITDAFDMSDAEEMRNLCENFSGSARELSDKILQRALELSQNIATDDMTVTVCKILPQQL